MPEPPIYWISGPPAAGKTTLCGALLARFDRGFHLPVDELREWVVQGMADSVPWTDESERQFQVAEGAVCGIARHYQGAGFAVAIDHCRNPRRIETVLAEARLDVLKILLMPDLAVNLDRNHRRTNKPFDPRRLDETIEITNGYYRNDVPAGWHVIDNSALSVEETVELLLSLRAPT